MTQRVTGSVVQRALFTAIEKQVDKARIAPKGRTSLGREVDFVFSHKGRKVLVEVKTGRSWESMSRAIEALVGRSTLFPEDQHVLVVPKAVAMKAGGHAIRKYLRRIPEGATLVVYHPTDGKIRFDVIAGERDVFPAEVVASVPAGRRGQARVGAPSLTSPKAFRVVRYLLRTPGLTQKALAEDSGVSIGLVNRVVTYLRNRDILAYRQRGLYLENPWRLLDEIMYRRPMSSLLASETVIQASDLSEAERAIHNLAKESNLRYALALFNAARRYTSYFAKEQSVYAYVDPPENISTYLPSPKEGQRTLAVRIYSADTEDIFFEAETKGGLEVTSLSQTLVDLACLGDEGRDLAAELLAELSRHE